MITKPLLASPAEPSEIRFPVLATPKLDGIRCLKVDGKVLSRKFKPIPNKYTREILEKILPDGFDGEIITPGTFNDCQSLIMSFDKQPEFIYHAFDYVKDSLNKNYKDRIQDLKDYLEANPSSFIKIVEPVLIHSDVELLAFEEKCLLEGYEGVMIRSPEGRYKCGRSTSKEGILLKIKRFEDSEGTVIEFIEKMSNENEKEIDELGHSKRSHKKEGMVPAGTLGSVILKDIHSGVEFGLGSGFDDITRQKIFDNQEEYKTKIFKYKFQPAGVKEAPRFPTFIGIRHEDDL